MAAAKGGLAFFERRSLKKYCVQERPLTSTSAEQQQKLYESKTSRAPLVHELESRPASLAGGGAFAHGALVPHAGSRCAAAIARGYSGQLRVFGQIPDA